MKLSACVLLGLLFLCGCSTVGERKQEKAAAYNSLSPSERALVSRGQIERGMDTNAVYIAWGKPSTVMGRPSPGNSGRDETWIYYGNRPVLVPAWAYVPSELGYWIYVYQPQHHSESYVKAEVLFHNGRVAEWKKY